MCRLGVGVVCAGLPSWGHRQNLALVLCVQPHLAGDTNRAHKLFSSISLASSEHTKSKVSNEIQVRGLSVQLCVLKKKSTIK